MPHHDTLAFAPFRLDLSDERLWREQEVIRLTPKAFAVLRCLTARPGRLVTKGELLDQVWPDTAISEATLTGCIQELRRALGDRARSPQFIQTVYGRGYRFIAPVLAEDESSVSDTPEGSRQPLPSRPIVRSQLLVGREAELHQLNQWYASALHGMRQVGFITGEAGIGKTALVEAFVARYAEGGDAWVGHGQCVDQYGAGEAYRPILEALGRLCRGPDGTHFVSLLQEYAPSWLVQMPTLLPPAERETLWHTARGVPQARMLRELTEALDILTTERPLILVLEDLHWSDGATLEWLAYVARRRDPACLLILGTYRPVEAIVHAHPLRIVTRELLQRGQCVELALDYLSEAGVAAYLSQRFDWAPSAPGLSQVLHQRTNGNPLFLIALVEDAVRQGVLQERADGWALQGGLDARTLDVPDSIRHLIEQQFDQLQPEDQALLEAASVVGATFSLAAVAAGIAQTADAIEAWCANLARQGQFVQTHGLESWPDETVAARYGFIHTLYQEVVYARISPGRCLQLHQQIGLRLEDAYGLQAREIAAELAMHFVHGRDPQRAVQYLHYAGENALQRSAHQEAIAHLSQGLELLEALPDTQERLQQEVGLQNTLGAALSATKGSTSPEVEQAYTRAYDLCRQLGNTPHLLPALRGLWHYYVNRTMFAQAQELGEQILSLAQRLQHPVYEPWAHYALGNVAFWLGDFAQAHTYCQHALTLYDAQQLPTPPFLYGEHPNVQCLVTLARVLWYLGYPDRALQRIREACTLAEELAHPSSLAHVLYHELSIHQHRRNAESTLQQAEALITMADDQAFPFWAFAGRVQQGWAQVALGQSEAGLQKMHQGRESLIAINADIFRPGFLMLQADACGKAGQIDAGLRFLAEAKTTMESSQTYYIAAEICRLKGELILQQSISNAAQAAACLHHALDIARHQHAKSWELRAALSLSRLWREQDRRVEAHQLLTEVYGWFTEGFDTADLQDAKALLDDLS